MLGPPARAAALAFLLAAGACASEDALSGEASGCPMQVRDVQVTLLNAERGVALTFATAAGDVKALRERVRQTAAQYAARRDRDHLIWHWSSEPARAVDSGPAGGGAASPPAGVETRVEEVEGGARLWLAPRGPGDLKPLRQHARAHRERYRAGQCWRWAEPAHGA